MKNKKNHLNLLIVSTTLIYCCLTSTLASVTDNQRMSFTDYDGNGYSDVMFYRKQYGVPGFGNVSFVYQNQKYGSSIQYSDINYQITADYSTPTLKNVGVGKFDKDHVVDIVWKGWWGDYFIDRRDSSGTIARSRISKPTTGDYYFLGIGDFNGDGISDIIWRSKSGACQIYQFSSDGAYAVVNVTYNGVSTSVPEFYQCAGIADFDGDQVSDLFWIGVDGNTCFWKMAASGAIINVPSYNIGPTKNWHVVATGDICSNLGYGGVSDGISDIVWEGYENGSKRKVVWQISPNFKINGAYLSRLDNLAIKGVGDYDADGNAEMLAQDNTKIGYAKITSGTVGGGLEFSGTFTAIGSLPEAEPIPQYSGGFDLELHSNRQFESRLRPTADFSIYNIPDGGNVNFNKSRLFSNLDLSGLVMGACPRGFFCGGGGVAIGKRWVMFATHVYNQKEYGELIYFVDPENKIHWSKILDFYKVGGDSTDITLAYLSTDLPPSVKIYSVLPSKMEALYRSNFGRIPVFTRNQFGKLIVFDRDPQLRFNPINSLNDRPFLRRSLDIERAYFSRQLIVGDSGNPVFIVVDDEPVLTGLLWESYGEGGYSSNVSANIDLINNIMASRGGERLKVFSLDKFIQH